MPVSDPSRVVVCYDLAQDRRAVIGVRVRRPPKVKERCADQVFVSRLPAKFNVDEFDTLSGATGQRPGINSIYAIVYLTLDECSKGCLI